MTIPPPASLAGFPPPDVWLGDGPAIAVSGMAFAAASKPDRVADGVLRGRPEYAIYYTDGVNLSIVFIELCSSY